MHDFSGRCQFLFYFLDFLIIFFWTIRSLFEFFGLWQCQSYAIRRWFTIPNPSWLSVLCRVSRENWGVLGQRHPPGVELLMSPLLQCANKNTREKGHDFEPRNLRFPAFRVLFRWHIPAKRVVIFNLNIPAFRVLIQKCIPAIRVHFGPPFPTGRVL